MRERLIRFLCPLLAILCLLAFTGCGKEQTSNNDSLIRPNDATADSATKSEATPDNASATELSFVTEAATQAPTAIVSDPAELLSTGRSDPNDSYDATGFVSISDVIPDVVLDIRYYTDYNFVGAPIDGYEEPIALLSKEATVALAAAADDLREDGYLLKIFDAYRPQRAVSHFAAWADDYNDAKMKDVFYPDVDKSQLFNYGYIAYYSGHSRGSKVDLTIVDSSTGEELDMGSGFDFFGSISHPDYTGITSEQYENRMILQKAMTSNGFYPCDTEWWDFTLSAEPYPNTYFDFPVSYASVANSYGDLK